MFWQMVGAMGFGAFLFGFGVLIGAGVRGAQKRVESK